MYKKILIIVLMLCLVGSLNVSAEDKKIEIDVSGKALEMSAKIMDGELYLPLRAVSEGLGYDVQWFDKTREIRVSAPEKSIDLNLTENKVAYNQHEAYINGGYRILNGRTYLRQDFFSNILGLKVMWDKAVGKVTLESVDENAIVINTIKESSETDNLILNFQYPELKGLENAEVEAKLNSLFAKLAEEAKARGHEIEKYIGQDEITRHIKGEAFFNYEVKYNQKGLLSIVFLDYQYTGGAHGLTIQSSYTFDLKTGTEYKLKDFFKDGTDYVSMLSDEVKKQMEEREMMGFLPPFEAIKAEQDFYLSNSALMVYFQAYEYTPYAAGIPEFAMDFPWIKGSMNPTLDFLN